VIKAEGKLFLQQVEVELGFFAGVGVGDVCVAGGVRCQVVGSYTDGEAKRWIF